MFVNVSWKLYDSQVQCFLLIRNDRINFIHWLSMMPNLFWKEKENDLISGGFSVKGKLNNDMEHVSCSFPSPHAQKPHFLSQSLQITLNYFEKKNAALTTMNGLYCSSQPFKRCSILQKLSGIKLRILGNGACRLLQLNLPPASAAIFCQ